MENKNLTRIIILFFALFVNSCSQEKKVVSKKQRNYFEIHFQNHFSNDTLSLEVGGCKIFDKHILITDEVLGTTKYVLSFKSSGSEWIVQFLGTRNSCPIIAKRIRLGLILNSKSQTFEIDLRKGKYIGLNNTRNDSLTLNQSKTEFYYY